MITDFFISKEWQLGRFLQGSSSTSLTSLDAPMAAWQPLDHFVRVYVHHDGFESDHDLLLKWDTVFVCNNCSSL